MPIESIAIADQFVAHGLFENAKAIARAIPHARLVVYPTGGHLLVGRNEEAFAVTIEFLKGQALDCPS